MGAVGAGSRPGGARHRRGLRVFAFAVGRRLGRRQVTSLTVPVPVQGSPALPESRLRPGNEEVSVRRTDTRGECRRQRGEPLRGGLRARGIAARPGHRPVPGAPPERSGPRGCTREPRSAAPGPRTIRGGRAALPNGACPGALRRRRGVQPGDGARGSGEVGGCDPGLRDGGDARPALGGRPLQPGFLYEKTGRKAQAIRHLISARASRPR